LTAIASASPLPVLGDEASVAAHYERCRKLGIRIARRLGVENPEAVFHEAYLSVLNRPDPEPKAWAYLPNRIKSRAQSAFRSGARRSNRLSVVSPNSPLLDSATSGAAVKELSWLSDEFRELVAPLDDEEMQAVVLFYCLNWPISKIAKAAVIGATKAAVKTRLFRIREKLRRFGRPPKPRAD
jgi:RNA polymerase sigma factor (sigma-70 family)